MDTEISLPLTEVTTFILLSLSPTPRHGYAIMKDVRALSKNRIILSTGTLYGALKRLLDQGWIIPTDDPEHPNNGRQRKAYALTDLGRFMLEAEVERMEDLVQAAKRHTAGYSAPDS
jgi:DNA-binding PadR family transcriptional regulator